MSNLEGGRTNQKLRTQIVLVEAAAQMVRQGKSFTVAEVADRARVGRATAYRYFPSVEKLVVYASLHGITEVEKQTIGTAFESSQSTDERLRAVVEASDKSISEHNHLYRTMLQQSLIEDSTSGDELPRRSGARRAVVDSAIGELRKHLGEKRYERLTAALSLFIGIEAAVVLRDVCLLSQEKARDVKVWGAVAILEAALAEISGRTNAKKHATKSPRALQYLVELGHRTVATQQKPPPIQGADAAQHRSQLVDLRFMTITLRHGASLRFFVPHTPRK